jgi:magnesium transporter
MVQGDRDVPKVTHLRIEPAGNVAAVPDGLTSLASHEEGPDEFVLVEPAGAADLAAWALTSGMGVAIPPDLVDPDEDSALFQRRRDALFIQFPTNWDESADRRAYLGLLCLPNRIIAVTGGSVRSLDTILKDAAAPGSLRAPTTAALLTYLMSAYAKLTVVTLRQIRNDLAGFEADLAAAGDKAANGRAGVFEEEARVLSRQVAAMLDIVDDQAFVVRTLGELHSPVLNLAELSEYLDDLSADSDYAYRVASRLEARFGLLIVQLERMQADATDRRLRLLTIISAVFLPLTLITGYFGMNFTDMPLLTIPHATLYLVLFMCALTAGLLLYFRRRQWY